MLANATATPAATKQQQQQQASSFNGELYERIRVLGRGSFGTAVVHRRRADCALVVLKEIELTRLRAHGRAAAIQEARIMSELKHENIISYYNAYTTETKLIIEMEYARMGTLQAYLVVVASEQSLLEEVQALGIFRQLTSGLAYLHARRIVHLDLKTANVFVSSDGVVKLGDFGIAQFLANKDSSSSSEFLEGEDGRNKRKSQPPATTTMAHLGTLAYSSPERCLGLGSFPQNLNDHNQLFQSDVWSLGCILYELLTLRLLFPSESLAELVLSITQVKYKPWERRDISPLTSRMFEQTIAQSPEHRPSAQQLLQLVDMALSQLEITQKSARKSAKNAPAPAAAGSQWKRNEQVVASNAALERPRRLRRLELGFSSEQVQTNLLMAPANNQIGGVSQINYPHSLIYQIRLDGQHVEVARVNLPQSKRIKQICKGRSHYLALTYDHIVYGWGSRHCGQLGACKLSFAHNSNAQASTTSHFRRPVSSRTTRTNSFTARAPWPEVGLGISSAQLPATSLTQPPSLASSTQTLTVATGASGARGGGANLTTGSSAIDLMKLMNEAQPTRKPFVLGELNKRKIERLAAGNDFSVFLSKTGIVMTCGDGSWGCLGRGSLTSSPTPCMVDSLLNMDVVSVACGPEHVVAVCGNGRAFAWGALADGRLGLGSLSELTLNKQARNALRRDGQCVALPQQVTFNLAGVKSRGQTGTTNSEIVHQQDDLNPMVVNAFCGDKCTIFIDSQHKCWATGENKRNKLGLDVKRRFRRTLIVSNAWRATRIAALEKFQVISCNIGANHATFLTLEGKLIVLGQDLDHSYALNQNLRNNCESFRQIASDLRPAASLQTQNKRQLSRPEVDSEQLTRSLLTTNQLAGFKISSNDQTGSLRKQMSLAQHPIKATRFQRRQVETYLRRSRAMRRAPFEHVLNAVCTDKFTLALTNDNRVYFWGTRSHWRDFERIKKPEVTTKPQEDLMAQDDESAFIKIGATNSTLMNNIELLGSDQPILQARDPQLSANSLADLWILDYRPASASCTCAKVPSPLRAAGSDTGSCSCISCSASQSISSCCSSCEQLDQEEAENTTENTSCAACSQKHDAILEPQPIVSLYVPSMFNHTGALKLVNLFCHDDERFFLVLDTTIKQQQQQQPMTLVNRSNSSRRASAAQATNLSRLAGEQADNGEQQANNKWRSSLRLNMVEESQSGASHKQAGSRTADKPQEQQQDNYEVSCDCDVGAQATPNDELAFHNQLQAPSARSSSTSTNNLGASGGQPAQMSPTSHNGGLSLEEPRSMSTFACSPGTNIILGPSLAVATPSSTLNANVQPRPLLAGDFGPEARRLQRRRQQRARHTRRRHRSLVNLSESTAITCDETSTMPTWVRNEYFQQQQPAGVVLNQLDDEDEDEEEEEETACSSTTTTSTLDHLDAGDQSSSSGSLTGSCSETQSSALTIAATCERAGQDFEPQAATGSHTHRSNSIGSRANRSSESLPRSLTRERGWRRPTARTRQVSCSQPNLAAEAELHKVNDGGVGGSSLELDARRWTGANNIGKCRVYQTAATTGGENNNLELKFAGSGARLLQVRSLDEAPLSPETNRLDVPANVSTSVWPSPAPPLSSSCVEVTMVEMLALGGDDGQRASVGSPERLTKRLSQSQTFGLGRAKAGGSSRASLNAMRKSLLKLFC